MSTFNPEFEHPFTVHADGSVTDAPSGVYAPEVLHSEEDDIEIFGAGWVALTGYTGQYGYHGAVMHASEQFAGGIAEDVIAEPGTYVLVVVEVMPEDDDPEPEPAGWAVLRMEGPEGQCPADIRPAWLGDVVRLPWEWGG